MVTSLFTRLPIPALLGVLVWASYPVAAQETGTSVIEQKALDRIKEARGHARQERYALALAELRVAVALAEQYERTKLTLALALHNMAEIHRLEGNPGKALAAYRRAMRIYTELNHKPAIAVTQAQIDTLLADSTGKPPGRTDVTASAAAPDTGNQLSRIDRAVERIRKRLRAHEEKKPESSLSRSKMTPGFIEFSESSGGTGLRRIRPSYADSVKRKIDRTWQYPPSARSKHQEGAVELEFTILSSGELDNIRILRSSGFSALDMESLRTVREAAPFNRITLPLGQKQATLRLRFNYKLPEPDQSKITAPAP